MDISVSGEVEPLDPDHLFQEMVDCRNGLNTENRSKLNGIVDGFRRSLQDYFDEFHPGMTVPQNGTHFQMMMSCLEELAFGNLEMTDVYTSFAPCAQMADDFRYRTYEMMEECLDPMESIRDSLADVMKIWEDCANRVRRLALHFLKMLDLAKKPIRDTSHLGILRKGIHSVVTDQGNEYLRVLGTVRKYIYITKYQLEVSIEQINNKLEFRQHLIQAQNGGTIKSDIVHAFLHFLRLPEYWSVLLDERFSQRTKGLFILLYVGPKGEDEDQVDLEAIPYEILNCLLEKTPSSTEEGGYLRRKMVDNKAIHLVLDYLRRLTEASKENDNGHEVGSPSRKREKVLQEQEDDEGKVACLLNILVHFIGTPEANEDSELLSQMNVLMKNSALMAVLLGYLRKDSVLEFAEHVPLYEVIFKLIGLIASVPQIRSLLMMSSEGDSLILELLKKLTGGLTTTDQLETSEKVPDALDLMQLFPDIQATTALVEEAVMTFIKAQ